MIDHFIYLLLCHLGRVIEIIVTNFLSYAEPKKELATLMDLSAKRVDVWYKNKRAKKTKEPGKPMPFLVSLYFSN